MSHLPRHARRPARILLPLALAAVAAGGCRGDGPTAGDPALAYVAVELPAFGTAASPDYGGVPYESYSNALGDDGTVVGAAERSQPRGVFAAALWRGAGAPLHLSEALCPPAAADCDAAAFGVNRHGHAVGTVRVPGGRERAWLWDGGAARLLEELPGETGSLAAAINSAGDVVGWSELRGQPVLWPAGATQPVDLGTPASREGAVYAITDDGLVVGWVRGLASPFRKAAAWLGGTATELASLGGPESLAFDASTEGQIVGWAHDASSVTRAVTWDWRTGAVRALPGAGASFAQGVNEAGDVVGAARRGTALRAVLWRDGARHDLTDVVAERGLTLTEALDVNAAGQIIALGVRQDAARRVRAFLLTPRAR